MTRAEINRRYYDKTRRKVHAGKFVALCQMSGPVGRVVTCKSCLFIQRSKAIGSQINEYDRKRLAELFRKAAAEKSAKWRTEKPEKARAASRRYHAKHRDVLRVTNRHWREQNRGCSVPYRPRSAGAGA